MKPLILGNQNIPFISLTNENKSNASSSPRNVSSPFSARFPNQTNKLERQQSFHFRVKSNNEGSTQFENSSINQHENNRNPKTASINRELRKMNSIISHTPTNRNKVRFKTNLREIEEVDYLLGNKTNQNITPKKKHLGNVSPISNNKNSTKITKNFSSPLLSETPKDFIKSPYHYDPNFKKTFESYLNGGADLNTLMDIKNFPSVFEYTPHESNKLTYKRAQGRAHFKSGALTERKTELNQNKYFEKKRESSSFVERDFKKAKSMINTNKVSHHFNQIKEIIKQRLLLKKKIKKEAFQLNDWNVKFFQNFYSITKEYIEKITKKDLVTVNPNKHYYEKDYPTYQRLMRGFTIQNYTKTPRISSIKNNLFY